MKIEEPGGVNNKNNNNKKRYNYEGNRINPDNSCQLRQHGNDNKSEQLQEGCKEVHQGHLQILRSDQPSIPAVCGEHAKKGLT